MGNRPYKGLIRPYKAPYDVLVYYLVKPYKALLGSVVVAVAVAVLVLFRYLSNGGGSRKL